jgi:hypothetical protein
MPYFCIAMPFTLDMNPSGSASTYPGMAARSGR